MIEPGRYRHSKGNDYEVIDMVMIDGCPQPRFRRLTD